MLSDLYSLVWSSAEQEFWLWLAGALISTGLLYRFLERAGRKTPSLRIFTHPSALLDYRFLIVHKLTILLIVGPALLSAVMLGLRGSRTLTSWLGPGPDWTPGLAALLVMSMIRLVLFDVGHYISHWILHKVPFFWEFHKVHHAAEVMTPVTAYRTHPVEALLDSAFQAPLQAFGLAVFYFLYGDDQTALPYFWTTVLATVYFVVDSQRHSHVWLSFGPHLEHILSSPAQHQIHHSRAPQHLDKNLSRYFSFIDWVGGTLYVPREHEPLDFGLGDGPDPELRSVWTMHWVPVKRAFRLLSRPELSVQPAGRHPR